jgi:hypothetical protein
MKVYIRQIRPYEDRDGDYIVIKAYDKWYPEDMENELRRDLKHYSYLEFEERYVEPLPPRCNKCVYEIHCPGKNTDINQTCHNYKRDAPDGGYYG